MGSDPFVQRRKHIEQIGRDNGVPEQWLDAFRHAYASGEITRSLPIGGEATAKFLGDANERKSEPQDARDRNMDLWNNAQGREYGKTSASEQELIDKIIDGLMNGDLITDFQNDSRTDPATFPPQYQPYYLGDNGEPILPPPGSLMDLEGWTLQFDEARSHVSPIALDLDGDGLETTALYRGAYFDHDYDGFSEQTGWIDGNDGLLVRDLDGNGLIDSGRELLGNETLLASGQKAANGFQALASLDDNSDGKIDAFDQTWVTLNIWKDLDGDGYTGYGELLTLAQAGVQSIDTGFSSSTYVDEHGNEHRQIGTFTRSDGTTGSAADIWFVTDRVRSIAEEWVAPSATQEGLPDAVGLGQVFDLHQAMARDASGALQSLVEAFEVQNSPGDRTVTLDDILFRWTGVNSVLVDARGTAVDARKVAVLEKFSGQSWDYVSPWDGAGLIYHIAGAELTAAYRQLAEQVYAQLMSQAHLKDYYDLLTYAWDETSSSLKVDPTAAVQALDDLALQDPVLAAQLKSEFVRTLRALVVPEQVQGADISDFGSSDDTITLSGSAAVVHAGAGGDSVDVTSDVAIATVYGGDGNDTIQASGSYAALTAYGEAGNDALIGGDAADSLDGGDGDDSLTGGAGDDLLQGGLGNDTLYGGDGNDVLLGSAFDGELNDGNDTIYGGSGDDYIWTGDGSNVAYGDDGNDWMVGGNCYDEMHGGAGDDLISVGAGGLVYGDDGDDRITVSNQFAASSTVYGGAGNDVIAVGTSMTYVANTFSGGTGNDSLTGSWGADTYLYDRGDGEDTITEVGGENDEISFGAGITSAHLGVFHTSGTNDMVLSIADPNGIALNDRITVKNWYQTTAARVDRAEFADGTVLTASQLEALAITAGTEGDDDLQGTLYNDTIYGYGGADTIEGNNGNDVIYGGDGNDVITDRSGDDVIYGEAGDDTISVATVNWGSNTVYGGAGSDVITVVASNYSMSFLTQTLSGGTGSDTLTGSNSSEVYLYARGDGSDTITNGASEDKIVFAAGIASTDLRAFHVSGSNDLTLGVADSSGSVGDDRIKLQNWYTGGYKLGRVEFSNGTFFTTSQLESMVLTCGTEGNDTLAGTSGNDTIYGFGGNDTITSGTGTDVVYGGDGNDWISDAYGNGDLLYGEAGDDTIRMLDQTNVYGSATAYGGAGNDTISVISTSSQLQYYTQTLVGGTGNDTLNGGAYPDYYLFGRGDGSDTITDLGGTNDRIILGAGIVQADVAYFHVSGTNDLLLKISDPSGVYLNDQITIKNWYPGTLYKIERVDLADGSYLTSAQLDTAITAGTEGNDTLVGTGVNDYIYGYGGNDAIQSGAGNDLVYGGDGNDWISDAYGNGDLLYGEAGDDTIRMMDSTGYGYSTAYGGAGNDTISVISTSSMMQYYTQTFVGGTGNDTLYGSWGADYYLFSRGDGVDTIYEPGPGGSGDRIIFGSGIALSDITASRLGTYGWDVEFRVLDPNNPAANDRITVKNWYNGGKAIEQLQFADGTILSNLSLGDGTNNTLTGTVSNDFLSGGGGNDTLNGSGGVDLLSGDAGDDTISGGAGNDVIHGGDGADTASGDDGDDLVFGDAGADSLTGGLGSDYLAGGTENDTVDGGDGTDVAQGGVGDDQVLGGAGNDLLTGDAGDDSLDGGDGSDFLAGGAGNDSITTGSGSNVVAFNAGGGVDTVYSTSDASNTLSIGGGIRYSDLTLSKSGDDLLLNAGGTDQIVLKDWYAGKSTVESLQIILDASTDFDANSSDPLYNKKVESFDFLGMVGAFDQALAESPGLTSWAITNALLEFHLSGSDDEALGGDLAYWYGKNGALAGMGLVSAQQAIGAPGFGNDAQQLHTFNGLQEGLVKLA